MRHVQTARLTAAILIASGFCQAARADTIDVTTTAMDVDANGGDCDTLVIDDLPGTDGEVSPIEALCAADHTDGADEVVLEATTYTLTEPQNFWYGPNGLPPSRAKSRSWVTALSSHGIRTRPPRPSASSTWPATARPRRPGRSSSPT